MGNQHTPRKEDFNPVSRKTNEEIDEDDDGNLIIGGEISKANRSVPIDGPFSEDTAKGENSLTDNDANAED
jgi:hypothetical protein